MSLIGAPIGAFADGGDDLSLSQSVPSPVDVISDDPTVERIYLLIAHPYDPVAGAETTVYISSGEFVSASDDSPALEQFDERLINPYNVDNQLFEKGQPLAGTSTPAFGAKTVTNGDGGLDEWADYEWAGRTLETYLGTPGRKLKEFAQIAESKAAGLSWDLDQITIPIRDFRMLLDKPINETLYSGTGGLEGGESLEGKPKPKVYGRFFEAEPVLVEGSSHTYQVNDGAMQAIDTVRDRGVELTLDADVADITTASPAAGEYATSLATGYIKLGEQPDGKLTVSGQGDSSGSLGYQEDPAGVIRKIVTEELDFTDPDDLDTGSFSDVSSTATEPIGYTTRLEQIDGLEAITEIAGSMIHVTFTRLGTLSVGRIVEPSTATEDFALTADDLRDPSGQGSFEGRLAELPTKLVRLGWKRYQTTLSPDEIAGSVSEDDRQDLGEEFRIVTSPASPDSDVLDRVPEAETLEIFTRLALSADAQSEADRVFTLMSPTRKLYQAQLETGLFRYEIGDIVEVTRGRYGLSGGKKFVVLGYVENAGEFGGSDQIILTLWG